MNTQVSRRNFMALTAFSAMGSLLKINEVWANAEKPNSKFKGVQIGVITYSYRSMPHNVDQLLQFCIDSNVSAIELMGDAVEEFAGKPKSPIDMAQLFRSAPQGQRPQLTDEQKAQMADYTKQVAEWRANVPMDKFKEVRKKYNDAGVTIYAFKPNAFGANNTDAEVEYGMRVAKVLGAASVTVELPTDPAQTQRLGDLGAKHKVYMGYHNHLQATDTLWDTALAQSPYNSINFDCGHYLAAGGKNTKESLMAFIEAKHDRISTMHLKDRTTKENGQGNLEWGKGDTPIKEMLTMIRDRKYKFPVTVELEYNIPAGSDAVKEVAKCVAFAKNILVS
ncbi:MAG: sugar phosphate isomerase/epimerase [Spirosomataceae bacterium]